MSIHILTEVAITIMLMPVLASIPIGIINSLKGLLVLSMVPIGWTSFSASDIEALARYMSYLP